MLALILHNPHDVKKNISCETIQHLKVRLFGGKNQRYGQKNTVSVARRIGFSMSVGPERVSL
jgi:hypothetical protein